MPKAKLTKKYVDSLRTEARGGVRYFDTELQGFGVKVHPTGRKVFFVMYGPPKRRRQGAIGVYGRLTVDEARDLAIAALGDVVRGRDPIDDRRTARGVPAFGEWVEQYLRDVERRKKRPAADKRFLSLARTRWGNKPLDKITTDDVRKVFDSIGASLHPKTRQPLKITANRWLASVRACLQAAWRADLVPTNPAMKIRPYPENEPRTRVLTKKELDRLQKAVMALENPHLRAAFTLLMSTGARLSEVLKAKWEDVDLGGGEWRIPSPKAGRPQVVPLVNEVVRLLRGLPRLGPLVVPGHNDPEKPRFDLKKPWEAIREAAAIPDVHIHDLRRTYGLSIARHAGLHVASKLLRHADVRVTERHYAPLGLEELRKASETHARGLGKVLPISTAPRERKTGERDKRAKGPAKVLTLRRAK